MTADEFRSLALSFPESIESSHMDHPDFRVGGKIFATLSPDETKGMVKLIPEQQAAFLRTTPGVFQAVNGAWGRRGATYVVLKAAKEKQVLKALAMAWRNTAPKRLVSQLDDE